ncbi:lysoplasmalogenase family protein [Solimicrobium silvestre]|uniref:YhhN-like protein n=1 Tax=Solimicrobium silvestre TaxID=2099400 RepID=A0A2S9H561_9BURK|nr:lysoplasmalogenase family protein [Solimicrobium silvestre]PRC95108.1 YhhN-like protein [Solimicrobium silvestre]
MKQQSMSKCVPNKITIVLNLLFLLDAIWQIWALATHHTDQTLISKFLLCFILALLLSQQLANKLPLKILAAVLFCLAGDILLQPLDLNYADMTGTRPINFVLGVLCFCAAYGNLARYYLALNPDWREDIKAQPLPLVANILITLAVLIWITLNNQAPAYLLLVLWLYSPIVVGAATLAVYTRSKLQFLPYLALVLGSNVIVFSDTIIGLTAFVGVTMPWFSNPIWILSTYILGIFLVFNAILCIEKTANV